MRYLLTAAAATTALMLTGVCLGQEKAAAPAVNPGIQKLLGTLEDAFSRADAKELAGCWVPGGEFVGPGGQRIDGRESIEKAFADFFASRKDGKLRIQPVSVRPVAEGVALVDAVIETASAPAGAASVTNSTLVLVQRDGGWLIESARETTAHQPSQVGHLKDFDWMVGDWATEASSKDAVSLQTSCDWTINRSFLIRKFKVAGSDVLLTAGTEIIGWDPRTERVRSWVFDSSGAFGENVWIQDGARWLLKYSGTLADGAEVSATHIFTKVDANTATFQSKDRAINGIPQPDTAEVTIHRHAGAKPVAKTHAAKKPPERVLP